MEKVVRASAEETADLFNTLNKKAVLPNAKYVHPALNYELTLNNKDRYNSMAKTRSKL